MPTTIPVETPARPRGVRRVLYESGYSLSAFPIALVAFIVVLVDLALGVALAVFIGGILLISVGLMVARGFARFERIRMRGMLGREAATPSYICAPAGAGFWRRSLTPLKDPQSWLDVVWSIVGLVTGTIAFAVTLAWWAGAAGGLTYWFWQRFIPDSGEDKGLAELLGLGDGRTAESWLNLVLGALFLLTLPLAVRLVTTIHASLASVLLSSRAELQREVARVEGGRDAARIAEAESLRRLERDIHDGPQQRLVRLSMDLGRARRQLDQDPERAAATLDEALAQTRETVAELRSLSPRHRAAAAGGPRPRGRARGDARRRASSRSRRTIDVPAPAAAARRDRRLLRGRRGAHERRQAQRCRVGRGVGRRRRT